MRHYIVAATLAATLGAGSALAQNATGGSAAGLANAGPQAQSAAGASVGNVSAQGGAGGRAEVGNGIGNFSPSASAGAAATAITTQGQHQGQGQLQGQGQIQGNIGLGSGNETTINYTAPPPDLSKLAPNFALGGLYPSANCHGTSNIGGSGGGFSIGFGTSWKDDDCGIRETARLFGVNTPDGVAVLCSSSYAASAPSCKALAAKRAETQRVAEQADKRKTSGERERPVTTAGISYPVDCVSDEFIARRMGAAVCR